MWSHISIFKLLVALCSLLSLSMSQDVQVRNYEMSDANANPCQTIIDLSRFDGDCCSLNNTDAGGCVLNVVNGRCKISGQFWTIDWTSTYDTGGAKCPPSEFPEYAPAAYATATEAPADNGAADGATDVRMSALLLLSAFAAGFVAIAL